MTSAVEVVMWEARPGANKYSEKGQLVVKKSDPFVKPTIIGQIYVCCGRGFLTKESLDNHTRGNCLQLEENSEKRPKRFDELSQSSYFSNLLMLKPACEDDDLSQSLPEAFVVLERLDPAVIVSACRRKKDIPRLPTVINGNLDDNRRSLYALPLPEDDDFQESRITKPVSSLYPLPQVLSTSCDGVAENVTRKPFECVYCVFSSKFFSNLSNHYKRQHPETKEAGVDFAKHYFAAKSIAKKRIQSKLGSKSTRHYSTCKLCSRRTSNLKDHIKNSHVKNGQECKLCNSSFASSKGLKLHITFFHNAVLKQNTALNSGVPSQKSKNSIVKKHQPRTGISNTNSPEPSFKCHLCHIKFGSDPELHEHKNNSHVPNSQYRCVFCTCGFTNDTLLNVHLAAYHNAKHIAPALRTPTSDSDPEKTFKCTDCTWKFKRLGDLQYHRVNAHVVGGFQCTDCSCSFSTDDGLKRHMGHRHSTHEKRSPAKSTTKSPIKHLSEKRTRISLGNRTNETGDKDLNEDQSVLTCPEGCNCPILDKETLENHLKLVHPQREESHSFACKFCNEKFPAKQDRNIHQDEKHATLVEVRKNILRDLKTSHDSKEGKKGVLCELCPAKITSMMCLDYHLKTSHNPDFQYQCLSCSCRFETERGLDIHTIKTHHSKAKLSPEKIIEGNQTLNKSPKKTALTSITCTFCRKRQKDHNDLILHLQTAHVPDGKFQCQSCCCCYNTEVELTDHNYNAHANILERQKFVCDLCGSAKYTLSHLEEHKRKEHAKGGKFFCTKCSCRFTKHKFLKRHLDRVHNIPNYQIINCTVCSAEIYSTAELNFHMKAAHVENGLACSFCPCQFSSQLFLDSHLKQDHPENETEERSPSRLRACRLKPVSYNEDFIDGVSKRGKTKSESAGIIKTPDKFSCADCASTFSTSTVLSKHMITCHDKSNTFACKECPCVFANQRGVDVHCALKHQKTDEGKSNKRKRTLSETQTEDSNGDVNNSFQSKTCSEIFLTDNELNEPTESQTDANSSTQATEVVDLVADDDCQMNDIFEDASDSTDMDVGNISSNFSEVNSISTQATLIINSPQKEPTKQLSESPPSDNFLTCRCKKCSIIFISIDLLLDHLKMAHKVNTLFKCSLCRATFVSPLLLTKHLKIHAPLYATEAGNTVAEAAERESPPNKKLRNSYDSYVPKIGVDKPYRCRKCAQYYFDTVLSLAEHIRSQHDVSEYTACTKCELSFMTGDLIGLLEHEKKCLSSNTRDSLNRNDKELASAYNRNSFSAVSDEPNVQIVSKSGYPRKSSCAKCLPANTNEIEIIELEYSDDDGDEVNIVEEIGEIPTVTNNSVSVIPLSCKPADNFTKQNPSNDIGIVSFTDTRIGDAPTANSEHIRFECMGNNQEEAEFIESTTPITIISLSDDSNDAFDVNIGKSNTTAITNEKTRQLPKSIFETSDFLDRYRTVFNVDVGTSKNNNKDINSGKTNEDSFKPYRKSPVARKSTSGIPKHRSKIFLDRFFGRAADANESERAKSSTGNVGGTLNPEGNAVIEETFVNNEMSKSTSQDIHELQKTLSNEPSVNFLEDESCLSTDDDGSNISVQHNMSSDCTITDYDSSTEVDYSDICFKCGDSFLNLQLHEVQCTGFEAPLETPEICNDMVMGTCNEAAQDTLEDMTVVEIDDTVKKLAQEDTLASEETVSEEPTGIEPVEPVENIECPELCITCGNTFPSLKDHETECPVLQMELSDMPLPVREENEKRKKYEEFVGINLSTPCKLTVSSVEKSRFVDKPSCSSKSKASSTPKVCKIPRFARSTSVTSELSTSSFSDSDTFSSDSSFTKSRREYNKIIKKKSLKKTRNSPNTFARNVETPRPSSVTSQSPRTRSSLKKSLVEDSSDDELIVPKGGWKRKSPRTIMSSNDDNSDGEQNETDESKKAIETRSQNQMKKPVELSLNLFPKSPILSLRSGEKRRVIQNSPRASISDAD